MQKQYDLNRDMGDGDNRDSDLMDVDQAGDI